MIWSFSQANCSFAHKKRAIRSKKLYFLYVFDTFWQFFTVFPFLMPKSKLLPLLITKEWPSLFTREQWERFTLFHEWIAFLLFSSQKTSILLKKLINQNLKKIAFPQLYPGELQTTCKCMKFEKSLKLTHPIVYTSHKTLYSL